MKVPASFLRQGRRFFYSAALLLSLLALLCSSCFQLKAQAAKSRQSDATVTRCYDPADPDDIRLWKGDAPGARGNNPCRDIPFVRVYPVASTHSNSTAHPAILVIPGGGYDRLSDEKEQAPVAEFLSHQLGITAFVLYYRLVQPDGTYRYPTPMWDGQRAIRLVRNKMETAGAKPPRVGLLGFSAGGHLASTLALHPGDNFGLTVRDSLDSIDAAPDFLALGYPVISMLPEQYAADSSLHHLLFDYSGAKLRRLELFLSGQLHVTRRAPPVFLFESSDDRRISPENSVLFAEALRKAKVPLDYHLFAHGIHGAGLARGIKDEEQWPSLFAAWVRQFR